MSVSLHTATRRATAIIAALCLACGATLTFVATAPAANKYPASLTKAFVTGCAKTAASTSNGKLSKAQAKKYCTAALKCIESKLTLKQFKQTVEKMQSGEKNPGAKVFTSCEKSAIKQFKKS